MSEHVCQPGEIFVFGSNRSGFHGAGAAYTAHKHYGAIYGQGEGPQGRSYALPTMDHHVMPLSVEEIAEHVRTFLDYARQHPEQQFFLTKVACGLGGKTEAQIAPLFADAPDNVRRPINWYALAKAVPA